ncbi:MAG TPA: SH3 domain-containing protein [Caldilineaceae bacterium]|nr:SH3 domain-containing protein [Caldilineaceae bacterium]
MNPLSRPFSLLFALSLLLAACGDTEPQRADDLTLTPQAGGMVMPTAQPPATLPATSAPAQAASSSGLLAVGQVVRAVGERSLRLQADAHTAAPVLEVYPPGATFTVIEPSADFAAYPVEVDGRTWYRLEAEDGLVGWAVIDSIEAQRGQ